MNTLSNVFNDILLLFILSESSKDSSLDCVVRPTEGEFRVKGTFLSLEEERLGIKKKNSQRCSHRSCEFFRICQSFRDESGWDSCSHGPSHMAEKSQSSSLCSEHGEEGWPIPISHG